ncbi:MAG: hypothetical protein A3F17_08875 [Gammaproteobacteria bacterium RIFCSPHIGHO2_12_FULL_41_15]|nr:MAG: hypothetical protein A3F17_08875 [Gammaproteobacteria bacterium RIFCSPHIGHO2_12_FULL_41_15]
MVNGIKFMVLFFIGISLVACRAHIHYPYQGQHCPRVESPKPARIAAATRSFQPQQTLYRNDPNENYQVIFLKYPSVGNNGQEDSEVDALYYRSKLPGKHKLLVVMPIWGGSKYPPYGITATLLRESKGELDIIRVLGDAPILNIDDLEDSKTVAEFHHSLKILANRTQYTITDVRHLVDWAVRQNNVDPQHVNIVGFSKSTIIAAILAETDPNITGLITVMGGSNPAEMIYFCNYYKVRKKITARFHWSDEKLMTVLNSYLSPINVAHYPRRLDPCHVLIFDSHDDLCVARQTQDELWNAVGKPERISFLYDHAASFGAMTLVGGYFMRYKILDFINHYCCSEK